MAARTALLAVDGMKARGTFQHSVKQVMKAEIGPGVAGGRML